MIGYGKKRGFGRVVRAETVLGLGKKMIARHEVVQLPLNDLLDELGKGRDDGDGTEVWGIGETTGFVNGMNDRVFPGRGKITGCETGVDDMEEDMANGVERKL